MNELPSLLLLELRSLYGINKLFHTRDKKEKNRYYLLGVVWLMLIAMVFFYVGGLVYGLCLLGMGSIVPAYLTVLSSMLIVAYGIFTAGSRIFSQRGYDMLLSLPVRPSSVVLSRILALYGEDLLLTLAIFLPGLAVYAYLQQPGAGFYLTGLLGILFVPAIPLAAATVLGTAVLAISSRMRHKSLIQTGLMLLLVVGILVGSFRLGNVAEEVDLEALASLAQQAGQLLGQLYPPALWLGDGMTGGKISSLGLFLLISAAAMGLLVFGVSRCFTGISQRLAGVTARHDYQMGHLRSRGLGKALYIREVKRYFSSSIYVTNTIIGPILGAMMVVSLAVAGLDTIQATLPPGIDIPGLIPFVFAGVFCTMTTTSVSISMEGKEFWVIKSLPIPAKALLDSKILLNLSLMLPFYLISVGAMAVACKPDFLNLLWLALIPGCVIVFSVVFGITVNLKFHSFDWEKEEAVVKQSLSAMLGGFAGLFLAAILGVGAFLIPAAYGDAARAWMCLMVLLVTGYLYRRNNRVCLTEL